jgi:hypothetical protein
MDKSGFHDMLFRYKSGAMDTQDAVLVLDLNIL